MQTTSRRNGGTSPVRLSPPSIVFQNHRQRSSPKRFRSVLNLASTPRTSPTLLEASDSRRCRQRKGSNLDQGFPHLPPPPHHQRREFGHDRSSSSPSSSPTPHRAFAGELRLPSIIVFVNHRRRRPKSRQSFSSDCAPPPSTEPCRSPLLPA